MRFEEAVSEDTRQTVHIAMGGFALALPYLPWFYLVMFASMAVAFNIFGIQKVLGMAIFRPGERLRRLSSGIVLYPLAIVGLLLVFPNRLDIVAGAWGVLAVGDGLATIVGRRYPVTRMAWNPDKSLGGTLAFAVFGGTAASLLALWCADTVVPPAYRWYPFVGGFLAAAVAAAVETIPVSLDDNVSVTASSAAVLWLVSLVSADMAAEAFRTAIWILPLALFLNILVASAGFRAGTVTVSGAVAGALLGTVVLICGGWQGWLLLFATFVLAVLATRAGLRRKLALGIAEERGGRRGAGNAFANTGVAAVAALMSTISYAHDVAVLAFVAALAAGGSDTVASEIGKAWGRTTYLVTTLRRVAAGTPGAMSLQGTVAGLVGATLLALIGFAGGLIPASWIVAVVVGATVGALVESVFGATLEPRGVLNNDMLNFVNTAVAAGTAVQLTRLL